jgi:dihydropteroate synthase
MTGDFVFPLRRSYQVPLAHGSILHLGERPLVMGVLNLSPDSFAEVRPLDQHSVVDVALQFEAEGAELLDIGGESSRPGAAPVAADEELARVLPAVRALAGRVRIPMSIDTYKASVARACVSEGVAIVNDISGLQRDPSLGEVVAETGAALILMHNRGESSTMYAEARYDDVVDAVAAELLVAVQGAIRLGVALDRLMIDPGIGFAKRAAHSYGVLARLPEIAARVDRPLVVGPSRKSFMREALDGRPATERDWGTAAAVTAAVLAGAHVVRVHAVGEMAQVVRVAEEIRKAR